MGHSGDGTEWNETLPANSEDIEDGANEIRDLRKGANIRASWEHSALAAASVGMIHKTGSAVAYYQATAPTADGKSVALANNNTSNGRIWVDSDDKTLWVWTGSAFEKVMVTRAHLDDDVYPKYAKLAHRVNTGVASQTLTADTWNLRTLETEVFDPDGLVSLNTNQIIFAANGEYEIRASAPGNQVNQHKLRFIQNSAGAAGGVLTAIVGENSYAPLAYGSQTRATLSGRMYVNDYADDRYELQHWVSTTKATNGGGTTNSATTGAGDNEKEIYGVVEIWKVSDNTS